MKIRTEVHLFVFFGRRFTPDPLRFSVLQDLRVICCILLPRCVNNGLKFSYHHDPSRWRRGSGWTVDREIMFDPRRTPTSCAPSNGNEVKDVFGRPGARVMVGMTLAAQGFFRVPGLSHEILLQISHWTTCLVTVCLNIAERDVKHSNDKTKKNTH